MEKTEKFELGQNITYEVKGKKLILEIDTAAEGKESTSGKTKLVANSGGFQGILPGMSLNVVMTKKKK